MGGACPYATAEAIDSKLPLRPPRALNCGMALKRQETDHGKRKTKDDNDLIKPGRITMKPTIEQNALVKACTVGTPLLLEDGIMEVKVTEKISDTELKVKVVRGGKLKARKGVNVPTVQIDCAALTEKDIEADILRVETCYGQLWVKVVGPRNLTVDAKTDRNFQANPDEPGVLSQLQPSVELRCGMCGFHMSGQCCQLLPGCRVLVAVGPSHRVHLRVLRAEGSGFAGAAGIRWFQVGSRPGPWGC
eukprot:Skav211955  [mRNA]  locus=scaffold1559:121806:125304:- [translate_table: standard]